MASVVSESRYTFAYSSSFENDNASRSISGLNVGNGTESMGPHGLTALNALVPVLASLTRGTLNNGRWIREQAVIL